MNNWFIHNGKVLTLDGKIRGCCCDGSSGPRVLGLFRGFTYARHLPRAGGIQMQFNWQQWGRWKGSWWLSGAPWFTGHEVLNTCGYFVDNPIVMENFPAGTTYEITFPSGDISIKNVKANPSIEVFNMSSSDFDNAPAGTVFWSEDEPSDTYTHPFAGSCSYPAHTKLFQKIIGPLEPYT